MSQMMNYAERFPAEAVRLYRSFPLIRAKAVHTRDDHGNGTPNGNGNPMGFPW